MMDCNGSKVYSVEMIKQMAQTGFSEEFVDYLDYMPEYLRKMVLSWANDGVVKGVEKLREYRKREETINIESEDDTKLDIDEELDEQSIIYEQDEDIFEENNIELNTEKDSKKTVSHDNPYKNLVFGKRVYIDKLYACVVPDDFHRIHEHKLVRTQVIVSYDGSKKYGMLLNACPECKELFILGSEMRDIEMAIRERQIEYHFYG